MTKKEKSPAANRAGGGLSTAGTGVDNSILTHPNEENNSENNSQTLDLQGMVEEAFTPRHVLELEKARAQTIPPVRPGEKLDQLSSERVLRALAREEVGDAEMLVELYEGRIVYDHGARAWYLWDSHGWERDRAGMLRKLVSGQLAWQYRSLAADLFLEADGKGKEERDALEKQAEALTKRARGLRRLGRIRNVLELAQSWAGITGDEWDADPWLLGVENGVIDLRNGSFRAGRPKDYIRTRAPVTWLGLHEPAPRWERFILEVMDGDQERADFLQRLLGYGITGLRREHILPVLWGEGRNGKDTLLETLSAVLGDVAGPVSEDVLLDSGRRRTAGAASPHLLDLQGRRLAWVSETNEGARLNAGQVKLITGGGTINARPLYGAPVRFRPTHLLLLITNHKPHAPADDYALWKRLVLVEFSLSFVEHPTEPNERKADLDLARKLRAEASGILAWLVRGCLAYQIQGLNPPKSVRAATEQYRAAEDTLGAFIDQCCITGVGKRVRAAELYNAYATWAERGREKPMRREVFGQKMKKRFESGRDKHGIFYRGIGLLSSAQKPGV